MPTYEIEMNGERYQIEAPDDNAASQAIKSLQGNSPSAPKEPTSTSMDMLKSAGAGLAQGVTGLAGLPGSIQNAFDSAVSGITGIKAPPPSQLSTEKLNEYASDITGGATDYKPETTAGKYTKTAAEFVPGAVLLGGQGGPIANALKAGVIPGVTSEAAGQAAETFAPSLEPYARFAGAVAGGMIPSALRAAVPTAEDAALSEIGKAAAGDNLTPQQMMQRLDDLGPQSMVADLGPNFQGQTGAIANLPGKGNEEIRSALNARNAGANARLAQTIDQTTGQRVIPSQIDDALEASQRAIGPQYDDVMRTATRVDTQPLADRLDAAVANVRGPEQQAVRNVRGYLNIPGTNELDPNPRALLATRQAIDGLMQNEQNPQVIRQLTMARQEVDDVLATAAPGIKDVDAQFSELARQRTALDEGTRTLDSGRTAPRPEELATRVQDGAQPQGTQIGPSAVPLRLSQGARAEIDRIVGTNSNDIAAINRLIKGEGDWNRAKLATLFGDDRADQLIRVLDNERAYADTRNFVTGNSLSANRLQYQKQYGGGNTGMNISDYYGAGGVLGAVRGAGVKVARALAGKLMDGRQEAINAEIAKNLTGREGVAAALLRRQLQGNRLAGPAKKALIQALIDQRQQLEAQ